MPLRTNSAGPPCDVASSGTLARHASSATMPNGSTRDGITKTQAWAMAQGDLTSAKNAGKTHPIGDAERGGQLLQRLLLTAEAGDDQSGTCGHP